ncbi:MAG: trypsin-like peptidase domain-containing protein [Armatimonadota bacterium]|nr:MAG: trypsin-like peptidase domain-containing protein [Armatimonadota bacterium]
MRFRPPMHHRGRTGVAVILLVLVIVGALVVWLIARGGTGAGAFFTEGPGAATEEDISRAVAKVAPAVVRINTTVGGGPEAVVKGLFGGSPEGILPRRGQGSGVIINGRRGYVLTNAHVARGAREIQVTLPDGRSFNGKVVGADSVTDIALVQIKGNNLPQAELGSAERLPVGSWVVAVGNPFGLENTVTAGVLSGKGRTIVGEGAIAVTDLLQTDAAINRGNSGGALIDLRGQVVGMPTAIVPYARGIGFAVAIDTAKAVIPELVRTGKVSHAWLGISYTTRMRDEGVVIQQVLPGTPAAKSGLKPGDVIETLQGKQVRDTEDVARIMRRKRPGDTLELTVLRQGERRTVTVHLGEMPELS